MSSEWSLRRRRLIVGAIGAIITALAVLASVIQLRGSLGSSEPPPPGDTVPDKLLPNELDVALSECERRARQAQVVFEPTRTMQVGRVEQVTVRASVAGEPPKVDGATNTTIEDLTVYCELQAALRGAKFDIDPAGFRVRSFIAGPTVSWTWDVTPKEKGNLRLTLEVQSLVRERTGEVDEFTTDVLVEAEVRSFVDTLNDAIVGFVTHPVVTFLGAGVLLSVFGGAFGYFRSKRKAD